MATSYVQHVFINCPFDRQYRRLFEAIVFAVSDCGFRPRCSLEIDDGSQIRIEKIFTIIADCRFGIHDISKTEPDESNNLPRFNMPLEFGMFLGAKQYGTTASPMSGGLSRPLDRRRYAASVSKKPESCIVSYPIYRVDSLDGATFRPE